MSNWRRFHQLFPHDLYMVWRIRSNPYLVAFDAQHSNLDVFTGGCFDNKGFADSAGEYQHGNLLLPSAITHYHRYFLYGSKSSDIK